MRCLRKACLLCLLLIFCAGLCGCRKEETPLLYSYRSKLSESRSVLEEKMNREQGITGAVCVIEDESVYNPALLQAGAGAVFNITDRKTVYSLNSFSRQKIASLTKLMTAYLAFEDGNPDRMVTLGDEVVIRDPDAWLCGFEPGDEISLKDLITAALVYSGNDAANGIAVAVSGSLPAFVERMNEAALELGATGTKFQNPNGLDSAEHYSTVYDVYLIFNACLKYPEFREIISMRSADISWKKKNGEIVSERFSNGNSYFNQTASAPDGIRVIGGKTGHTAQAGYCLAMLSSDAAGNEYISVVVGTKTKQQVYAQTNLLFEMVLEEN